MVANPISRLNRVLKPQRPGREADVAHADGTNPEQLFAAGYAACFLSALHRVARREKVELRPEIASQSVVGIEPNGSGGFGLAIGLVADMPGVERATAEHLVSAAHQVCPYSNAIRGNVDVDVSVA